MRLHSLTLEAFGPFPGREHVDFDALDDGILLVNGPTGSGKSSLLDAIAFGLFGDVPGARRSLRQALRSHHAAPFAAPRVEVEFSVGTERWRVERSPQWEAPKRRGDGTTTRQASVLLSRWRDGQWHLVSQRIDEAADVMTDTLGMRLDQFAQVVLLPQGEFAQFLRAKPEDRRVLLERLFDVTRFEAVEAWFAESRSARNRANESSLTAINGLLTVVTDALARLDDDGLEPLVWSEEDVAALPQALRSRLRAVSARREALEAEAVRRERAARSAERAVEDSQARERARAAHAAAVRDLERWSDAEVADMRRRLDEAARVTGVLRLSERADAAERAFEQAHHAFVEAETDLQALAADAAPGTWNSPALSPDALSQAGDALNRVHATAGACIEACRRSERAQDYLRGARTETATSADAVERARADDENAARRLADAQQRSSRAPDPARTIDASERLRAVLANSGALRTALDSTRHEHENATRAFTGAERDVIAAREARLTGIAGELGATLMPGAACPVCGALEHPAPALQDIDAPTAEQIEALQGRADDLDLARLAATTRFTAAQERWTHHLESCAQSARAVADELDALVRVGDGPSEFEAAPEDLEWTREAVGVASALRSIDPAENDDADTVSALGPLLDGAHARAERARRAEDTAARASGAAERALQESLAALAAAEARQGSAQESLQQAEHDARQARTALCAAIESLPRATLTPLGVHFDVLDPDPDPDPEKVDRAAATAHDARPAREQAETALATAGRALSLLRAATRALAGFSRAEHARDLADASRRDAARELQDELVLQGHDSVEDARAVALDEDARATLDHTWQSAVEARAAARVVLNDEEVRIAALVPRADERGLADRAAILARRAQDASATAAQWRQAHSVLDSMRHRVADAVRTHLPLAEAAHEMNELASTFSGNGENTHRMRLTSYVLAAHLENVTAMANERLAHMTDGRYQLRHTDERARGNNRSGLGLVVVDAWTGRSRDTATLSGGEAFMASLALALGLGDAVRADSGGMELHTLFVDEGFGSLDQDTLEQVMEVLYGLREGGRLVGVVSHVTELRARIPTHIEVRKTSEGSSVHTGTAIDVSAPAR